MNPILSRNYVSNQCTTSWTNEEVISQNYSITDKELSKSCDTTVESREYESNESTSCQYSPPNNSPYENRNTESSTVSSQQNKLLEKLSMDVMQHTQQSDASFYDIPVSFGGHSKNHLDKSNLEEFEADENALKKQRLRLYFKEKPIPDSAEYSALDLQEELESLENIVSEQKRKYNEIKNARERERICLQYLESKYKECEVINCSLELDPNDHQKKAEQNEMFQKLERIRKYHYQCLQQIQYDEVRVKYKLKAYKAQAKEIQHRLNEIEH